MWHYDCNIESCNYKLKKIRSYNNKLEFFLSQYHSIGNLMQYEPIPLQFMRYIGILMVLSDVAGRL